jgi:hypothetical protein
LKKKTAWLGGSTLLFTVAVLAEAKQIIAAFLPALVLLLFTFIKQRAGRIFISLAIFGLAILLLFSRQPETQQITSAITDPTLINRSITAKIKGFEIIADEMSDKGLGAWVVGLGPGNTISRVSLMAYYAVPDSPVKLLGLAPAPLTTKIWVIDYFSSRSSAYTGISSWLGIFGDWGLTGLVLYIWMFLILWKGLRRTRKWEVVAAKSVLLMTIILGAVYSWLEEPGYMLMAALIIALGLKAAEEKKGMHAEDLNVT